jgi:ketosteroid isomerase-like protein
MTEEERFEIAQAVSAAVDEYMETIRQKDLAAAKEFWADTDGFVIARDGTMIVGYKEWVSTMEAEVAAMAEVNNIELLNPHVCVLAPDVASYSMEFRFSFTLVGGEKVNLHGSFMYVFKYLDDRWRVVNSAGTHLPD